MQEGICVNEDCPMFCGCCPVEDEPGVCGYAEQKEVQGENMPTSHTSAIGARGRLPAKLT